jgi:hypothetical protein
LTVDVKLNVFVLTSDILVTPLEGLTPQVYVTIDILGRAEKVRTEPVQLAGDKFRIVAEGGV